MDSKKDGLPPAARLVLPLGRTDWTVRKTALQDPVVNCETRCSSAGRGRHLQGPAVIYRARPITYQAIGILHTNL